MVLVVGVRHLQEAEVIDNLAMCLDREPSPMPDPDVTGTTPPADAILSLPTYPQMKSLELADRGAVEACTYRMPCSSDHNFTSLWMWNTDETARIARAGRNLVVEFPDYETQRPCLTLIGDDDIPAAAEHVLSFDVRRLDFVPEFVAEKLPEALFTIEHDRDQDDYVLDTELLATLREGKRWRAADRFVRGIGDGLRTSHCVSDPAAGLLGLFDRWAASRGRNVAETGGERLAVERLGASWESLDVRAIYIFNGSDLIAANVYEVLPDGAISHYQKADVAYDGLFAHLQRAHCEHLATEGVGEINIEQDLGHEGLRNSKLSYRPVRFLRKYRVARSART